MSYQREASIKKKKFLLSPFSSMVVHCGGPKDRRHALEQYTFPRAAQPFEGPGVKDPVQDPSNWATPNVKPESGERKTNSIIFEPNLKQDLTKYWPV